MIDQGTGIVLLGAGWAALLLASTVEAEIKAWRTRRAQRETIRRRIGL